MSVGRLWPGLGPRGASPGPSRGSAQCGISLATGCAGAVPGRSAQPADPVFALVNGMIAVWLLVFGPGFGQDGLTGTVVLLY